MRTTSLLVAFFLFVAIAPATPVRAAPAEAPPKADTPAKPKAPSAEKPEKSEGPKLDDLSKKTWEAYQAKVFDLNRQGIEKASFDVKTNIEMPGRSFDFTGHFLWKEQKAKLTWDDAQAMQMLGSLEQQFGHLFRKTPDLALFGTATLTASPNDDGSVDVDVKGPNPRHFEHLKFGSDGLLASFRFSQPLPSGQTLHLTTEVTHTKVEGKLVVSGQKTTIPTPMGNAVKNLSTTWEKHGNLVVPTKILMKSQGPGGSSHAEFDFTNWKIGDEVKTQEETPAPKKPAPAPPTGSGK